MSLPTARSLPNLHVFDALYAAHRRHAAPSAHSAPADLADRPAACDRPVSAWHLAFCVVAFDVDLGPTVDYIYPALPQLGDAEKTNL